MAGRIVAWPFVLLLSVNHELTRIGELNCLEATYD